MTLRPLSNIDLDNVFDNTPGYLGTHSKDLMQKIKIPVSTKSFSVINLQDSKDGGGTHWVASFNNPKNTYIYYFDSYGIIPSEDTIKWLKKSGKRILYNTTEIQSLKSVSCGFYCIAFIKWCLGERDYLDFVGSFTDDGSINNEIILKRMLN